MPYISPFETIASHMDNINWEIVPEFRVKVDPETFKPTGAIAIYGRVIKKEDQPRGDEYAMQIDFGSVEKMVEALQKIIDKV